MNQLTMTIGDILLEPELLKDVEYQQLILVAMEEMDGGYQRIVECKDGVYQVSKPLIELLTCFILLRRYRTDLLSEKKSLHPSIRKLPHSVVRYGSYVDEGAILMPFSFVNMGARVGKRTTIDTGGRIGSGAYVGNDVHISGGVGLGGVLEPKQEKPVIIEDGCFIGANSSISEGVHIGTGTWIGAGAIITGSTRIYDSRSGEAVQLQKGSIPSRVVAVPASYKADSGLFRPCIEIIHDLEGDRVPTNPLLRK